MPRESSPDSTGSTLSNITVDVDISNERSSTTVSATPLTSFDSAGSAASLLSSITLEGQRRQTSTGHPTTSVENGNANDEQSEPDSSRRRSGCARHSLPTYNLNVLSGTAKHGGRPGSRTVSGDTLVGDDQAGVKAKKPNASLGPHPLLADGIRALDLDWRVDTLPGDLPPRLRGAPSPARRSTRLEGIAGRITGSTVAAGARVKEVANALGKRGREAVEGSIAALKTGTSSGEAGGEPASKRSKLERGDSGRSEHPATSISMRPRQRKKYLVQGLYAGMDRTFDPRFTEAKNKKRRQDAKANKSGLMEGLENNKTLPAPMFAGERLLETGRDFQLPWDVFSPLPKAAKPEEWKKTSRNRFVGDASTLWKKSAPLPPSHCTCPKPSEGSFEKGCSDNCHNRHMMYECDESNCRLGLACSNRSFADLKRRIKKGNPYDIGVEVAKTGNRGYGVRAMRTFEPGQIIMEYTGEIVTSEEMERRMNDDYKDNDCYYMMEFQNGMYIDATRGSMARFVNHSCEPNCEMVKWVVAGQPRMALFSGDQGIVTGDELTYDYNFQNFAKTNIQTCHCGAPSCRGVLGPRAKEPPKKESVVAGAKRKLAAAFSRSSTVRKVGTSPQVRRRLSQPDDEDDDNAEPPTKKRLNHMVGRTSTLLARAGSSIRSGNKQTVAIVHARGKARAQTYANAIASSNRGKSSSSMSTLASTSSATGLVASPRRGAKSNDRNSARTSRGSVGKVTVSVRRAAKAAKSVSAASAAAVSRGKNSRQISNLRMHGDAAASGQHSGTATQQTSSGAAAGVVRTIKGARRVSTKVAGARGKSLRVVGGDGE